MKKIILGFTLLLSALFLLACGGDKREEPSLELPLELTLKQGIKTDVTEDIVATDMDGNDLKEFLTIESNDESIEVDGNFITANEVGSFIIKVTVTDSVDKELTKSGNMFIDVIESDEVEEGNKTTYTFDKVSEEALNGFKVLVDDEEQDLEIENGELIYKEASKNAKLVKELKLEEKSNYKVSLVLKASKTLTNVRLSLFGEEKEIEIKDELNTYSLDFYVEDEEVSELTLELFDNEEYNLYVERMIVELEGDLNVDNLDLREFTYINEAGESEAQLEENKASITITEETGEIWKQKLILSNLTLEKNKTYFLTYTIKTEEDVNYEFIGRTRHQEVEDIGYYIWSAPSTKANEEKTYQLTFKTNDFDVEEFEIYFQLGNHNKGLIEISNIELKYFEKFDEETTRFTGLSAIESFEGEEGKATLYIDTKNNELVYDVTNFGAYDWHNKVFIENFKFLEDSRYRIEFKVKADRALTFFFAVNAMGTWDPAIAEVIELNTEYQTFTFETNNFQTFTQNFEILFQFGEHNEGSGKIIFESIEITQLVRK